MGGNVMERSASYLWINKWSSSSCANQIACKRKKKNHIFRIFQMLIQNFLAVNNFIKKQNKKNLSIFVYYSGEARLVLEVFFILYGPVSGKKK